MEKHYYQFLGYKGWKTKGYIIKCYSDEEYKYYTDKCGMIFKLLG